MAVVIKSEIDIHTAIAAVQEFAEKFPVERLSEDQAWTLFNAGAEMLKRVAEVRALKTWAGNKNKEV